MLDHSSDRRWCRHRRHHVRDGQIQDLCVALQERFAEAGVDGLLTDKTRPPGKPPVSDARVTELVRLTHEPPPHEATHWTARAMARTVGLALATVQKIWKTHGLAPQGLSGILCGRP